MTHHFDAINTTIEALVDALESAAAMADAGRGLIAEAERTETAVDAMIATLPSLTWEDVHAVLEPRRAKAAR
jgi:hypothetical protein